MKFNQLWDKSIHDHFKQLLYLVSLTTMNEGSPKESASYIENAKA